MGIQGLTSFISQNSERFHQPYKLHDSYLVVDGNSLACQLYNNVSNCSSAFGGDYDQFATTVMEFFTLLTKCQVIPLVVLDGGYEVRKLKTVKSRMKNKVLKARQCNPATQSSVSVFPLLMKDVFKQVLKENNVHFAQADFEADSEIASIARQLQCPVLSYDSDFYIYDVLYIPFRTLDLRASKIKCKDGSMKYAVNCQIYRVDTFIKRFGGLDKSLLPLMATLLGNDYVPACLFSKFYMNVKIRKSKKSLQQRRIAAVFDWLRSQNLDSAISKVLSHLKKTDREYVQQQIMLSVQAYTHSNSNLLSHLGVSPSTERTEVQSFVQERCDVEEGSIMSQDSDTADEEVDSTETCCDSENDSYDGNANTLQEQLDVVPTASAQLNSFPDCLREKFRSGELPPSVSDMIHLHMYFSQPQVEDFSLPDSHELSFALLQINFGLLLKGTEMSDASSSDAELSGCELQCFVRSTNAGFKKVLLRPILGLPLLSPLPSLSTLPSISLVTRKGVLCNALGLNDNLDLIDSMNDEWKLYTMAVVYWCRSTEFPKVTNCHIHSIVLCMIALGIVDQKAGYIRSKKSLLQKYGTRLKELKDLPQDGKQPKDAGTRNDNLVEAVSNVTFEDCLQLVEPLLQFHQIDDKVRSKPKQFSNVIVHSFAQLQVCLQQIMTMNSLLDYPFPQCKVSHVFSGTMLFMSFTNFNKRSNVESYVNLLMRGSPSISEVYDIVFSKFKKLLPNLSVLIRKGRRKNKRMSLESELDDVPAADNSDDNSPIDMNNKFSVLGMAIA